MTANCMGSFGTYQYMWPGYGRRAHPENTPETVWVTKRYIPTDLRVTAPVPARKLMAPEKSALPRPPSHWVAHRQPSSGAYNRGKEESTTYRSQPSTRCEEYSTLRSMLPSTGRSIRTRPPNWGTGFSQPPALTSDLQRRFPHINSPMTRYVDDMHLTNRLFKLH